MNEPKPDEGRLLTEKQTKLKIGNLINDFGAEWALHSHGKGKEPDILAVVEQVYDLTASIKDTEWSEKLDNHSARLTAVIERDAKRDCQARIEALIESVEKTSCPTSTNMLGINLSKIEWRDIIEQALKATLLKGDEG